MTPRFLLSSTAAVLLIGCGSAQDATAQKAQPAPASAAYAAAVADRAPEDAKLVWTPASVALQATRLAPGVFAVVPDDAAAKEKAGVPVATSGGIIVGSRGVLLVDTMINRKLANQIIALAGEQSAKPILYAVNTSYHGDHSYGNQFLPERTEVIQHANTQSYVQTKFPADVAFMSQYFGTQSGLDELRPQAADIQMKDGETRRIDLGGKVVEVMHLGFAQSEGDLFVWVPEDKVLFAGNPILTGGPSLPWLLDGHAADSLATLRRIRARFPADTVIVPGHGTPTTMATVDRYIAYLDDLIRQVGAAKADGLTAAQTSERVGKSMEAAYGAYKIYPWVHSQLNVGKVYEAAAAR